MMQKIIGYIISIIRLALFYRQGAGFDWFFNQFVAVKAVNFWAKRYIFGNFTLFLYVFLIYKSTVFCQLQSRVNGTAHFENFKLERDDVEDNLKAVWAEFPILREVILIDSDMSAHRHF